MHLEPLQLLAVLVGLGVLAQGLAVRLRIPAIVFLLGLGLLLGPGLGLLDPDGLFGDLLQPIVALAVGLVLFEGGLSLRFHEVRRLGRPLTGLLLGGLVVTFLLATVAARFAGGLSWGTAGVCGAILVVTGPTVIKPLLQQARLHRRPALLLKWEGIVNDPLGALLAVVVLELAVAASGHGGETPGFLWIPLRLALAGLLGAAAGLGLARAMDRGLLPEHLKSPAVLASVLLVFAGCDLLYPESGLLAVTAMGIVMANAGSASVEDVRRFKEEIATLLVPLLFLILSARLEPASLEALWGRPLLFVAAVLFVVRPAAVHLSLLGAGVPLRERVLLGWIAPRGIVAAAVAGVFEPRLQAAGYADAGLLVPLMFAIVISTVVLHGLSIRPLARALGLAAPDQDGVLLLGASSPVVDLARALKEAGVDSLIADQNRRDLGRARLAGIPARYGDILDEEMLDDLPLETLGFALAATSDDAWNALACTSLVKVFGRERVFQLTPVAGRLPEGPENPVLGRVPWAGEVSYPRLARRYWQGARFRVTALTEEFGWEEFQQTWPGTLVLFRIRDGRLAPWEKDEDPGSGTVLLHLPAPPGS